jgi:hypothetical protein
MNNLYNTARAAGRYFAYALVFAMTTLAVWAQDTSTTTVHHHDPSYQTEVRNAAVVYVEGNDLVLKLEDGKVEHLIVPDSDIFTVDGRDLSVSDLLPGTRLTQTITTTVTPRYVNTVRVLKGKVWHVNAPGSVIVSLPDGTNHLYRVPKHAKFVVEGKPKTVFDLRKGMTFEATIVTDESQSIVEKTKSTVGQAPTFTTMPLQVGALVFQFTPAQVRVDTATETASVSTEQTGFVLPKTGTLLPLAGLLGAFAVAMSLAVGAVRKSFAL